MSIIGKQLPEFTLDAFKKPELVKVSTADVLGKWSVFVFYPADFTFVAKYETIDGTVKTTLPRVAVFRA